MNTSDPSVAPVQFVDDVPARTPVRAFIRALRDHPGRWAKVPSTIATPYLRQIKTYGALFGVPIELRIAKAPADRWARVMTKAGEHAARRAGKPE